MKSLSNCYIRLILSAILLASLALTGCHPQAQPDLDPVSASNVAPVPGSYGPSPGDIKVHGHWIIEVKNPDGSLAERQEFDNALQSTGEVALGKILTRQKSVGGWTIYLFGSPSAFNGNQGMIMESTYISSMPQVFKNLTLDVPSSGENANKLVLSGTATALSDGNVNQVATAFTLLAPTSAPDSSYPDTVTTLTSKAVNPVFNLVNGQQIVITVIISFA
jgi:hypothetical protein